MPSLLTGYEYDIFISYRQRDNKGEHWVTEFVNALRTEIEATFKDDISIYFDENPNDGLLENNAVDESLNRKLKCLIFIPIVSQTYCDTKSFAWTHEFVAFRNFASSDEFGLKIYLANGNVSSRILPIKIHEIESSDKQLLERELGGVMRSIDFIYKSPGVNRPLTIQDSEISGSLNYRNQVNKVANAIKGIIDGMKTARTSSAPAKENNDERRPGITREIKEKDLVRVGLVYAVCALVLWKVVDLAIRWLSWNENISDFTALVLLGLFPVAVILAWKFEKAPTGFILSSSEAARSNPYSGNQKRPMTSNSSILSLLVIVLILYFLPQRFVPELNASSMSPAPVNKSIAVLYFDNMSGETSQEYLSDGLTEEIITRLTKITGLRVISRTSVRVYKGQSHNLKQIAKDLGVSAVLEGSVRKSGDKLRVIAQLIDANTDEHLWAETYDREISDLFAVQTDIAEMIADRFEIALTPEMNLRVNQIPTRSPIAYEYFLQAKHVAFNQYYYIWDTVAFLRAKSIYEKAIDADPEFALAYAGLADLYDAALQSPTGRTKLNDSLRHILSMKAYRLDPNSAFVNNVRIWIHANRDKPDIDSAFYHARKALLLEPNDVFNYHTMGEVLSQFGLQDMAIPFLERAADMNPLDARIRAALAECYQLSGNAAKAHAEFEVAYRLSPETQYLGSFFTVRWLVSTGRVDEASKMIETIVSKHRLPPNSFGIEQRWIEVIRGNTQKATEALQKTGPLMKSILYLMLKRNDEAIETLVQRSNANNDYLAFKNHPFWEPIRNDPRYQEMLTKKKVIYEKFKEKYGQHYTDFTSE
jgi:TolB-like protein